MECSTAMRRILIPSLPACLRRWGVLTIISTLPEITSAASYLTEYIFADTLSEGLTYRKNDLLVEWYLDKACTEKITEWEETSGKYTVAYGEHTMTITMTEEGLSEINSSYGGRTMRITYAATINSDSNWYRICRHQAV